MEHSMATAAQAYMDCYELSQVQGEKEIAQIFARRWLNIP